MGFEACYRSAWKSEMMRPGGSVCSFVIGTWRDVLGLVAASVGFALAAQRVGQQGRYGGDCSSCGVRLIGEMFESRRSFPLLVMVECEGSGCASGQFQLNDETL